MLTTTGASTPSLFLCLQDEWEETEEHSCLKQCNCPSDGSACSPSSSCKRENFSCKQGYKRFSNGDAECYPVKSAGGTPAWGVVLWVFFSVRHFPLRRFVSVCVSNSGLIPVLVQLLAGGASGIGVLWFYEHKLRTSAATDSLYHELSMDTGF